MLACSLFSLLYSSPHQSYTPYYTAGVKGMEHILCVIPTNSTKTCTLRARAFYLKDGYTFVFSQAAGVCEPIHLLIPPAMGQYESFPAQTADFG